MTASFLCRRAFSTSSIGKRTFPFESITNLSVLNAVETLKYGAGFVLYDNIMTDQQSSRCNQAIDSILKHQQSMSQINDSTDVSHETGHDQIYGDEGSQGTRIWNLLNKGHIFEELVQLNVAMEIFDNILGNDFILGSLAANHLKPGDAAQAPHLDYPYWDYNNKQAWTSDISFNRDKEQSPRSNFMSMNCQMLIMCDDFTLHNGPTAVLPFSQRHISWPDSKRFEDECVLVTGRKGSVLLFTGILQHCSTRNNSDRARTSILGQYLCKFVAPMENISEQVCQDVRLRATPRMKQLLGEHQIYPKMFEEPTKNSIQYENMQC